MRDSGPKTQTVHVNLDLGLSAPVPGCSSSLLVAWDRVLPAQATCLRSRTKSARHGVLGAPCPFQMQLISRLQQGNCVSHEDHLSNGMKQTNRGRL